MLLPSQRRKYRTTLHDQTLSSRATTNNGNLNIGVEGISFGTTKIIDAPTTTNSMKPKGRSLPSSLVSADARKIHRFQKSASVESVRLSTFREERGEEQSSLTEEGIQSKESSLHLEDNSSLLNASELDVSRISIFKDDILTSTVNLSHLPLLNESMDATATRGPSDVDRVHCTSQVSNDHSSPIFAQSSKVLIKEVQQPETRTRSTSPTKALPNIPKISKTSTTPSLSRVDCTHHEYSPLKRLELYSNNERFYYNDFDFVLASESYISSENEKNHRNESSSPIPKWNKITHNIPLTFIDDLHSEYFIQPLERTNIHSLEDADEILTHSRVSTCSRASTCPSSSKSFFLTQDDDTFEYKDYEDEDMSHSSNHVLLTKHGLNIYNHSFRASSVMNSTDLTHKTHASTEDSKAYSSIPARPHTSLSFFTTSARSRSRGGTTSARSSPNTSRQDTRLRGVVSEREQSLRTPHSKSKEDAWNIYPSRSKIILEHPLHSGHSACASTSMELNHRKVAQSSSNHHLSRQS
ncbi:hypothetical protein C9374_007731 [Naegleria lovaniensis]|uniref:Uncharacterized protein n=1 Tax=Naegleria lovaniensis TaxID=51637 RepID=A0AA88KIP3_NAELO|nr:uncharacterized protein C9374_007731 [Naegleria lovaniensis]KAG2379093.1 hypothetical protein C9374_007731 [Naegleria lovaniensis]